MLIQVHSPAPLLNTPDFSFAFGGKNGSEIPLNEKGLPYCFEFVALKGMVFQLEESIPASKAPIYRVSIASYPHSNLYLDSRFACPASLMPPAFPMPSLPTILDRMIRMIGKPYIWGGNWNKGIQETLAYYSPKNQIDDRTAILWTLQGVDCSGLLFEAADGNTPRNTRQLIHFGQPVPPSAHLNPLDMIVYPGHVIFIVDDATTIESKYPFGVILRNLPERFWELTLERTRVENWTHGLDPNKHYTVRRFVSN